MFLFVLPKGIVSRLQSNGIEGPFEKCRIVNVEVFEIAQELFDSALNSFKVKDWAMTS